MFMSTEGCANATTCFSPDQTATGQQTERRVQALWYVSHLAALLANHSCPFSSCGTSPTIWKQESSSIQGKSNENMVFGRV
jgi:hypothetical protein